MCSENEITAARLAHRSYRRRYELAKGPTQSTTWRQPLKKFGGGLAGLALTEALGHREGKSVQRKRTLQAYWSVSRRAGWFWARWRVGSGGLRAKPVCSPRLQADFFVRTPQARR
jgi:hypothetical protein